MTFLWVRLLYTTLYLSGIGKEVIIVGSRACVLVPTARDALTDAAAVDCVCVLLFGFR